MRTGLIVAGVAFGALVLGGCNGAHMAGRPERSLQRERIIAEFEESQDHSLSTLVDRYYAAGASDAEKARVRNEIIDISVILINQHYSIFIEEFSGGKKAFDSTMDIGSMATDAVAVITTPALTKSILAAISGGLTAAKTSIDKNYMYDQTIHVLIKQMEAQRREVMVDIVAGNSMSITAYPLSAALADLERYYFSGTFDGALTAIQQNAAQEQAAAEFRLDRLQERIERGVAEMREVTNRVRTAMAGDPDARKQMMEAITDAVAAMDADLQVRFVGVVAAAFERQLARNAQDGALVAISQNEEFWTDVNNALNYLRNQADDEAFAKIVGDLRGLGLELPVPD